jgi:hypothetical protein
MMRNIGKSFVKTLVLPNLIPMAMEAHKPIFFLKPADGAIGAHTEAVRGCYDVFKILAWKIGEAAGIEHP